PVVRFAHPPFTAVEQPIAAVTARAVELIIGARACRAALDTPVVVTPSLTVRESTAPPRS
ncbi:MAG: LacI family transcriptional regulator, partial [Sphingomonas sp.]